MVIAHYLTCSPLAVRGFNRSRGPLMLYCSKNSVSKSTVHNSFYKVCGRCTQVIYSIIPACTRRHIGRKKPSGEPRSFLLFHKRQHSRSSSCLLRCTHVDTQDVTVYGFCNKRKRLIRDSRNKFGEVRVVCKHRVEISSTSSTARSG